MGEAREKALAAKAACGALAALGSSDRDGLLRQMAAALRERSAEILEANGRDVAAARESGVREQLIDRLALDAARVEDMAAGLEGVAAQPDPLGRVLTGTRLPNGLAVEQVTVPLGVVAMVYEARPNVTSDAAGICIKTGNACVLRGGSIAARTCKAIGEVLRGALTERGLPADTVCVIESTDHAVVDELFGLVGIVDVLIPRGGAGLIRSCVANSKVPVIETGTGNCHVYVDGSADLRMATEILVNAKCSRPSVCNACESLLVDRAFAENVALGLPALLQALAMRGVRIHGDAETVAMGLAAGIDVVPATEEDWGREYLDLEISVKLVDGVDEAIAHINAHGTGHSECIVTESYAAGEKFLAGVDAAAVYVNASTRFTDGGMFGLGAEIGISTQRLHARGPMGAGALVTTKYVCRGSGQVR